MKFAQRLRHRNLGTAPTDEPSVTCGQDGYQNRTAREAMVFRHMLERLYPVPDHVFGFYVVLPITGPQGTVTEVSFGYDGQDSASVEFLTIVESNLPARWDHQALAELAGTLPLPVLPIQLVSAAA